jgi:VCBS repeat-containing protein
VDDVQVSTTEKTVISGKITGEDPDNDTLTYTKSTDPQHGTVTVSSDGSWSYTPYDGFVGDDEFKVLVSDGKGGSAIVTVKVKVNPTPQSGTQQPPSNLSQLPKTGSIWDRNLLLQIAGIITVMGALLHFFRRRKREKESN